MFVKRGERPALVMCLPVSFFCPGKIRAHFKGRPLVDWRKGPLPAVSHGAVRALQNHLPRRASRDHGFCWLAGQNKNIYLHLCFHEIYVQFVVCLSKYFTPESQNQQSRKAKCPFRSFVFNYIWRQLWMFSLVKLYWFVAKLIVTVNIMKSIKWCSLWKFKCLLS